MTAPDYRPPPSAGWWVKANRPIFSPRGESVHVGGAPAVTRGTVVAVPEGFQTHQFFLPRVTRGLTIAAPHGASGHTGAAPRILKALHAPPGISLNKGYRPLVGSQYFDDFNRADSASSLGSNWTNRSHTMGINSNAAYGAEGTADNYATYNKAMIQDDMKVTILIDTHQGSSNDSVGILLGSDTSGSGVTLNCLQGSVCQIQSKTSWTNTVTRASRSGMTFDVGDMISLERHGNTYTALKNGDPIGAGLSWVDSSDIVPRDSSHRLVGIRANIPFGVGGGYRRMGSWWAEPVYTPEVIQPTGPLGDWSLVFNEEFTGSSLDLNKWSSTWFGGSGYISNVHTDASNAVVSGGELALTLDDSTTGASINTNPFDNVGNLTKNGFKFIEGAVVEARIKFPGNGTQLYNQAKFWVGDYPYTCMHDIAAVTPAGGLHVSYSSGAGVDSMPAASGYWGGAYHTYTFYRVGDSAVPSVVVYYDGVEQQSYNTNDDSTPMFIGLDLGRQDTETYPAYGTTSRVFVDYVRAWIPA